MKNTINLNIIKSTYEGNTEQNGKNTKAILASDVRWTEAEGFPYAGTYVGFDEIHINVFSRLATEWLDYKVTIENYYDAGDSIIAAGYYTGTYKKTGKSFKASVAHIWTLKNGKAIRFIQYVDSKIVADSMVS